MDGKVIELYRNKDSLLGAACVKRDLWPSTSKSGSVQRLRVKQPRPPSPPVASECFFPRQCSSTLQRSCRWGERRLRAKPSRFVPGNRSAAHPAEPPAHNVPEPSTGRCELFR